VIQVPELIHEGEPFVLRQRRPDLADDEAFLRFARGLGTFRIETDEGGVVTIMSPSGWETGARNAIVTEQLSAWARRTRLGRATDSSALYRLGGSVRRAPDAAWISNERLAQVPPDQRRGVLPVPPDFVIELRSPTDSLDELKAKMVAYMAAGVRLGWLLDPDTRTAYEYRPTTPPRQLDSPRTLSGGPVLPGFTLDLGEVWSSASSA